MIQNEITKAERWILYCDLQTILAIFILIKAWSWNLPILYKYFIFYDYCASCNFTLHTANQGVKPCDIVNSATSRYYTQSLLDLIKHCKHVKITAVTNQCLWIENSATFHSCGFNTLFKTQVYQQAQPTLPDWRVLGQACCLLKRRKTNKYWGKVDK